MSAPYLVITVCLLYRLPPADSAPDGGAQCKKPDISTIDNMKSLSIDKEYYEKGEEVTVRCNPGHHPSPDTMTCDNPGSPQEWTPPTVTCIGVTMTDWRVTSTSISVRMSCTPDCPEDWRFHVQCCDVLYDYRPCKWSYDKDVTFTDLWPYTEYEIITYLYIGWKSYEVRNEYIRMLEPVPGRPGIVTVPSMEDNTIRWGVSDNWGAITGFQMNISARRDYNVSFAVDESMEFPPNVTEYKILLQYGTNYTITLRAFTSAGVWKDTTENIETPIGDPLPPHMEMTSDGTLHFHPVLDLNGPIGSYEVIVFADLEGNLIEECLKFKNTLYNSSGTPSHYTAAVLPAETLTTPRAFILGDDQHYNGFHNAPFIPNHNYSIYIRVTSRWNHVEKSLCAFAGLIRGVTREGTSGSFIVVLSWLSFGVIIGLLVALVGLFMVKFTPWMKQRHPRGEETRKPAENVCVEDDYYTEADGRWEDEDVLRG